VCADGAARLTAAVLRTGWPVGGQAEVLPPRGPLNTLTPDNGRQWGSNAAAFDSESCACCSIDGDFHSKAPCRCVCHRAGPSSAVWPPAGAAEMDENDSMPDWTSGDAPRGRTYNTPYYDDEAAAVAAMASRAAAGNGVVQSICANEGRRQARRGRLLTGRARGSSLACGLGQRRRSCTRATRPAASACPKGRWTPTTPTPTTPRYGPGPGGWPKAPVRSAHDLSYPVELGAAAPQKRRPPERAAYTAAPPLAADAGMEDMGMATEDVPMAAVAGGWANGVGGAPGWPCAPAAPQHQPAWNGASEYAHPVYPPADAYGHGHGGHGRGAAALADVHQRYPSALNGYGYSPQAEAIHSMAPSV